MITIDKLLEKYWAGETSLSEETHLRDYFSGPEVAEQHRPFAEVFVYQSKIANATLPDDFEAQFLDEITSRESTESLRSIRPFRKLLAVAAVVLFLLAAGVLFLNKPKPSNDLADIPHLIINGKIYYPATEAEAYQLTRQALLLVSSKMNKESKASIKSLKKLENIHPKKWGSKSSIKNKK